MKNKFIEKITLAILVVFMAKTAIAAGLPAQIPDKHVDNYQGYGEKYHCDITTEDQKKYSLDLAWSVVPNAKARFPTWNNSFSYKLSESGKVLSQNSFSSSQDIFLNHHKDSLNFQSTHILDLITNGYQEFPTRIGWDYTEVTIAIVETEKNEIVIKQYTYEKGTRHYSYTDKLISHSKFNLDIADSQCEKL